MADHSFHLISHPLNVYMTVHTLTIYGMYHIPKFLNTFFYKKQTLCFSLDVSEYFIKSSRNCFLNFQDFN